MTLISWTCTVLEFVKFPTCPDLIFAIYILLKPEIHPFPISSVAEKNECPIRLDARD